MAIRAANSLGVSGWVRNERDGSVTVEAQVSDIIKEYRAEKRAKKQEEKY